MQTSSFFWWGIAGPGRRPGLGYEKGRASTADLQLLDPQLFSGKLAPIMGTSVTVLPKTSSGPCAGGRTTALVEIARILAAGLIRCHSGQSSKLPLNQRDIGLPTGPEQSGYEPSQMSDLL